MALTMKSSFIALLVTVILLLSLIILLPIVNGLIIMLLALFIAIVGFGITSILLNKEH